MRITTIRVRRLKSKAVGYGHYAVEAEALVGEDENADDVRTALTDWVDAEIAKDAQCERLAYSLHSMIEETKRVEHRLTDLNAQVKAGNSVVAAHQELRELAEKAGLRIPGIQKLGDEFTF